MPQATLKSSLPSQKTFQQLHPNVRLSFVLICANSIDLHTSFFPYRIGRFITKIFHPNVSKQGEICVNTLKKDWKPEYGIGHILTVIKCLLIFPNPESALDEEAGMLLLENYDDYCRHARLITNVHATPRVCCCFITTMTRILIRGIFFQTKPVEFATSESATTPTPATSTAVEAPAVVPVSSENETVPTTTAKPASKSAPTNTSIPLQNSTAASNTPAPAPLSAATGNTVTKAVKRPANSTLDKRKKALKRL